VYVTAPYQLFGYFSRQKMLAAQDFDSNASISNEWLPIFRATADYADDT
jgi:hypothetical protein